MIDARRILNAVRELEFQTGEGVEYILKSFSETTPTFYYGLNSYHDFLFVMESRNPDLHVRKQTTSMLEFGFNLPCNISLRGESSKKIMHVLTCKSKIEDDLLAFIRLTTTFINGTESNDPYGLNNLFAALSKLFSEKNSVSESVLQGFFAELYTILIFNEYNLKLTPFWQKHDKLKFDFSINTSKKLEIKSTQNEERKHHFRHEQLVTDICDIVFASYLLRKDETGFSVMDAIESVRDIAYDDYPTILYIEKFIHGIPQENLASLKFDEEYTKQNLRFISAVDVDKVTSKEIGVTSIEYDSNLTRCPTIPINEIIMWIQAP